MPTFKIRDGYLGICARCSNDATHAEYLPFEPDPAFDAAMRRVAAEAAEAGIDVAPTMEGIWQQVCDDCCDEEAKHR